jgi:hypothetical protein
LNDETNQPIVEPLRYEGRYFLESAKSAVESAIQIVEEAVSNEDEAIRLRSERDGGPDQGRITVAYDAQAKELTITGDGVGMTSARMRERLGRLGAKPESGARRSYFNRGIRDVFLAMGGGEVTTIGRDSDGVEVLSQARFVTDADHNMLIETLTSDVVPDAERRARLGLEHTGTQVCVPVSRLEKVHPKQFGFGSLERSIRHCVGLRPVMQDPNREVTLVYGDADPRLLRFGYPDAEDLIVEKVVNVGGLEGTLWAKLAPQPIRQARNRRALVAGILIRGERSAYEIARDPGLAKLPAMDRVIGELRLDGIEDLQRAASDEDQLIYKTDRSGLVGEHPVVEAAYELLVAELEPLIAGLEAERPEEKTTPDVRRDLQKLAREINSVIDGAINVGPEDPESDPSDDPEPEVDPPPGPDPEPQPEPDPVFRVMESAIEFPLSYALVYAGETKTLKLWVDTAVIRPGSAVLITSPPDAYVNAATLSAQMVPDGDDDGVAELSMRVTGGGSEGRYELRVSCEGHETMLPLHVRFRRASGFISSIVLKDEDWEAGSAIWDPSSGVVTVKVGRPEFKAAAAKASREGHPTPMKAPLYRQLVVESIREAALWEAARKRAEIEWDEMPAEDRRDGRSFQRETQFVFQEFDYQLRAKLHKAFGGD